MTGTPDPQMQAILDRMRASPGVDYRAMPIAAARRTFEELARPWNQGARAVAAVRDLTVPGPAGNLRARLYHPAPGRPLPVTVFVHGGGWTFGSVETHDGTMRHLAGLSGCAVLGIDYRLAPEHPFPAGLDDTLAAIHFVRGGGLWSEVDGSRIALAGDSAGANLALAALLAARDRGLPPLAGAALFYGCFTPDCSTASHARNGDGSWLLSTEMMRWYWRNFLGPEPEDTTSLAAPLRADFRGLPPLYLNAAGLDPLLDDTVQLAGRLAEAGVPFRFDHTPGVVHGYLRMTTELGAARRTLAAGAAFLAARLNEKPTQGEQDSWSGDAF